jgi:Ca-activated chloride channel homolog
MIAWRDPASLALLALVTGLAGFLVWAARRRARALAEFVAAALQPTVAPDVDPRRRTLRGWLVVAAAALIVIAIAGPMWGFRWEHVKRQGIDLVVALDTSRSMLATDVKPNRLERAKLAVRDLVDEARGDRLGLVAFAGSAFLQCPLTLDRGAFLESLDAIQVGIIPRGGTALAAAIDTSLDAFEGKQGKNQAIVLITDGESHEGDLDAAIAHAKERGVRIFTVGIGTPEGELIPGATGGFVKDRQGQVVKSRLDEATLERIAVDTGGVYLRAAGAGLGLSGLYRDHIATLEKRELESTLERRYDLRYQLPLAVAFLLLLLEPLVGERRTARAGSGWRRWRGAVAAVLLAAMSVGWLDPHGRAREGNRLYDAGKFDDAAEQYNQALVDNPGSPALHLSLGDARYKAGKFDDAGRAFEQVPPSPDAAKRTAHGAYNLGNTKFRQGEAVQGGDPQKSMQLWTEALTDYRRALGADPDDQDAKFNHELVERRLAALKKKLEEQQKQQQNQQQNQQQQDKKQQDQQRDKRKQDQQQQDQQQGQQQDQQNDQQQQGGQQQDQDQQQQQQAGQDQNDQQQKDQQQAEQQQEKQGDQQNAKARQQQAEEAQQQQARQGEQEGAAQRPGEMTPQEAAALLDALRDQEIQPGDLKKQMKSARVAEPREDW